MAKPRSKPPANAKPTHRKLQQPPTFKSKSKAKASDKNNNKNKSNPSKKTPPPSQQQQRPTLPFGIHDAILLIGEGDFSFATALLTTHGCANVLATCLDAEHVVVAKYVGAAANLAAIRDITDSSTTDNDNGGNDSAAAAAATEKIKMQTTTPLMFNVDATKLDKHKPLKRRGPYDKIVFNFPHVGGLSRDVNRQVRANQALISAFLASAQSLLASSPPNNNNDNAEQALYDAGLKTPPSILLTVFEGEPYSLWNVRDLARSNGLVVVRSFRFEGAALYPGYRHARTLGTVVGRDGGESASAWRGEERVARMFEFAVRREEEDDVGKGGGSDSDSG